MNGTFTAIDKNGNFIKQVVANQETAGMKVFDAIDLVFGHMKSDIDNVYIIAGAFVYL